MTDFTPDTVCTCGSGKLFRTCCGDIDSPSWNERAIGRIHGTYFDPQFVKYVKNEPVCELAGTIYPPGILARQLGSAYRLQSITDAIVASRSLREATVTDSNQQKRRTSTRVTDIVNPGALLAPIIDLVRKAYAREVEPFFSCKLRSLETPQVLRYRRGSHYKPHSDSDVINPETQRWRKSLDRDYSLLIYLDDEFEGGELIFPNFNFRLRPTAGMLAAFPSDCRYLHGAMPVLSGVRHAIVSWCAVH